MSDKITYEFSLASGDIDWSDCNLDIERNGKKIWLGSLGSERKFNCLERDYKPENWLTYEDLERIALLFCHAEEMHKILEMLCFEKSVSRCKYKPESCKDCPIKKVLEKVKFENE